MDKVEALREAARILGEPEFPDETYADAVIRLAEWLSGEEESCDPGLTPGVYELVRPLHTTETPGGNNVFFDDDVKYVLLEHPEVVLYGSVDVQALGLRQWIDPKCLKKVDE